jgi:phosphate transport system permease protein
MPSFAGRVAGRRKSIRARKLREGLIVVFLGFCGVLTLTITVSIVVILFGESYRFFAEPHPDAQGDIEQVGILEFVTGLQWNPLLGSVKNFGMWPLVLGTFKITFIAMCLALPLGLMIAIWLSEYSSPRVRAVVKPMLEILAGIPTVVFGFFALMFITPAIRLAMFTDEHGNPWNPLSIENYNALAAGIAVGLMSLPIVSSLSEDALRAVPRALREGAYGLGASRFEVATGVLVPAALSGIVAAFLLAIARAVGETMIVALAAGSSPPQIVGTDGSIVPSAVVDPTQPSQTMTGYMVQIFLGDAPHGTVEYYSSYAIAATLFALTLLLTLIGGIIRSRFRQAYA